MYNENDTRVSAPRGQVEWGNLFIEGVVIVVSILLAFAIDAWWDGKQQAAAEAEQLQRVTAELAANSTRLESKLVSLERARDATKNLMFYMGPDPEPVDANEFHTLFEAIIRIGTLNLTDSATSDYLAAGLSTTSQTGNVRRQLLAWHDRHLEVSQQYDLLREHHADWLAHLQHTMPLAHSISTMAYFAENEIGSKFPFDPATVLSDPVAESLFATYLARLVIVVGEIRRLREEQLRIERWLRDYLATSS